MIETASEDEGVSGGGPQSMPRPIFAIFEGGGAKGVGHVGALQATQDNGLEIVGVAGTSAGALMAVMVAIGLEAGDIMSPSDPNEHILARNRRTPTSLLGDPDWRRLKRLQQGGILTGAALLLMGFLGSLVFTPRNFISLVRGVLSKGHFSSERIRDFVNDIVRERLQTIKQEAGLDWDVPNQVTFADLAAGWPTVVPLKIVATDVDAGTLELFDADATPNVVVAEAVAASISIPVVFRPAAIPSFRPGRFADGGMVSNLPLWAFSEEKLAYERQHFAGRPVPVVGFSLRAAAPSAPKTVSGVSSVLRYAGRLLEAMLQGSQGTIGRFLDDVSIVPLDIPLGLLSFDEDWERYRVAREAGRKAADRHLRFMLSAKPDRIQQELNRTRSTALALINRNRGVKGKGKVNQLRVNLIRPHGYQSLRVVESVGMETDADDRLLLDRRGRGAAEAFRSRDMRVFRLGPHVENRELEFMTKYERALVRTTVRSVVCVPIFEDLGAWALDANSRPEPAGVLTLDSDQALATEFRSANLLNLLVNQSAVLYAAVSTELDDG